MIKRHETQESYWAERDDLYNKKDTFKRIESILSPFTKDELIDQLENDDLYQENLMLYGQTWNRKHHKINKKTWLYDLLIYPKDLIIESNARRINSLAA